VPVRSRSGRRNGYCCRTRRAHYSAKRECQRPIGILQLGHAQTSLCDALALVPRVGLFSTQRMDRPYTLLAASVPRLVLSSSRGLMPARRPQNSDTKVWPAIAVARRQKSGAIDEPAARATKFGEARCLLGALLTCPHAVPRGDAFRGPQTNNACPAEAGQASLTERCFRRKAKVPGWRCGLGS
jgi:hypothetical protein